MTDHPLTEARVKKMWDAHTPERKARYLNWESFPEPFRRYYLTAIIRDAFDAGREHEREHTDYHHDPRPWQDCTRKDICEGDLVEAQCRDIVRIGVAHHKNENGNWFTEDSWRLTWADDWPLRRIPATPTEKETAMTEATPAALPHLTADDLRNTPAGRDLMAEAWRRGYRDRQNDYGAADVTPCPYKETQ